MPDEVLKTPPQTLRLSYRFGKADMSETSRKEIPDEKCRPEVKFNQAPTGHVTHARSEDDPKMEFSVQDCGVKAGGEFMHPFVLDERDLPGEDGDKRNRQGF